MAWVKDQSGKVIRAARAQSCCSAHREQEPHGALPGAPYNQSMWLAGLLITHTPGTAGQQGLSSYTMVLNHAMYNSHPESALRDTGCLGWHLPQVKAQN